MSNPELSGEVADVDSGETWAEFAAKHDAGLSPGSPAPDIDCLGAVYDRLSQEEQAELGRIERFGRPSRGRGKLRKGPSISVPLGPVLDTLPLATAESLRIQLETTELQRIASLHILARSASGPEI